LKKERPVWTGLGNLPETCPRDGRTERCTTRDFPRAERSPGFGGFDPDGFEVDPRRYSRNGRIRDFMTPIGPRRPPGTGSGLGRMRLCQQPGFRTHLPRSRFIRFWERRERSGRRLIVFLVVWRRGPAVGGLLGFPPQSGGGEDRVRRWVVVYS